MRFCLQAMGGVVLAVTAWAGGSADGIVSVVRADPQTGKLVRRVVVRNPAGLAAAVDRIAAEQSLPPQLVHSVIRAESNYNPDAVSSKGAQGLMQLEPATARRFGVVDSFNPVQNLQGGAKYLKYLLNLYRGDYTLALAAYNAGEQSVARYGGVPPFPETQKYVLQVRKHFAAHDPDAAAKTKAAPKAPLASDGGNHIQEVVLPDGSVRYVSHEPL